MIAERLRVSPLRLISLGARTFFVKYHPAVKASRDTADLNGHRDGAFPRGIVHQNGVKIYVWCPRSGAIQFHPMKRVLYCPAIFLTSAKPPNLLA